MGNVNLPTPVFAAAGALCLLGGYLLGVVAGPDTPDRTTAVVESYDVGSSRLCLTGENVAELDGASEGTLCGTWRRTAGSATPAEGDPFRFVSVQIDDPGGESTEATVIYGDVVRD